MGLLDWLKPKIPPQTLAAERLTNRIISTAQLTAVSSADGTHSPFPFFERIASNSPDRFLFTVIAAAVPLTMHRVSLQESSDFKEILFEHLLGCFSQFNALAPKLFIDCWKFIVKSEGGASKCSAEAGVWLIWNLKGTRPTPDEFREGALEGVALGQFATQWFDAGL